MENRELTKDDLIKIDSALGLLKKDLLEMSHAVNSRHVYFMDNDYICEYCGCMHAQSKKIGHRPDCIVLKARSIINT